MPPQSQTYTFPLNHASATDASFQSPAAWESMEGKEVTFFGSKTNAYIAYALSFLWSITIIVVDSFQIANASWHHGATNLTLAGDTMINENGVHGWVIAVATTMLVMDIIVLVTQLIDLTYFHFTYWPLTSLTWFGQLNGTGLASALLAAYMFYPHSGAGERDAKLSLSIFSLAAHAIFISAQFSVTIEYIIRSVGSRK